MTFKKGDRIRRLTTAGGFGNVVVGREYIVEQMGSGNGVELVGDQDGYWYDPKGFELVTDLVQEALSLLQSKGYTITPPKLPREWWINIWECGGVRIETGAPHKTKENADKMASLVLSSHKVRVACIKVVEGEGLNAKV